MAGQIVWICALIGLQLTLTAGQCYNQGNAVRCTPPFSNAAFNLDIQASHTCGNVARFAPNTQYDFAKYCEQTGVYNQQKMCDRCDDRYVDKSHPPRYAGDSDNPQSRTWWQSITLYEYRKRGLGNMVQDELILSLGKAFDITYVQLTFHSPRPESFAIFKKTRETDEEWIPYQYYSGSCNGTYGLPVSQANNIPNVDSAICVDDYSDISPLTGGEIVFGTMKNRPGAYNFLASPSLQEFVTATDIKIQLTRLNTFGDEIFHNKIVLQSYYYAISDISIGARCKCNGHASRCVASTGQNTEQRLVCECQHNTMGPDCGECKPMFRDQPWRIGDKSSGNECKACKCNGMASSCFFDEALYNLTGSGSHCVMCRDNTAGYNCDRCKENYYGTPPVSRCLPCGCDVTGSVHLQCDPTGRCVCKPGVTGPKCDQCDANYYDLHSAGCRECKCVMAGSVANTPNCSSIDGQCNCKGNVEGQNCDRCLPGFYNLDVNDPQGCMACFCHGHTSDCSSASSAGSGYRSWVLASYFSAGTDGWTGVGASGRPLGVQYNTFTESISLEAPDSEPAYFSAPEQFLKAARFSYNQFLSFKLRVGDQLISEARTDVILEGDGISVSVPIYRQGNPMPNVNFQQYQFRLNERADYTWSPLLNAYRFQRLLADLTAIKIRASFTDRGMGFLDDVELVSARRGGGGSLADVATWVETCQCPKGYTGQFCESCGPEYRRENPALGSYSRCIPCECNGHSTFCDVNSGRCVCQHNTTGNNCERCQDGFYGNALLGAADSCVACPCPSQGPCFQQMDGAVTCLNCPEGTAGNQCDVCADGYYDIYYSRSSDPGFTLPTEGLVCEHCDCNENIDTNAVGNCNRTNGICLKCIYNTTGDHCEMCLPGYYGDALKVPKGDCQYCDCFPLGTLANDTSDCEMASGQCQCRPNVIGRRCDQCADGYWNIESGQGCEQCLCNGEGSMNNTCDITTGQCECKPGVTGRLCDQCAVGNFGFSDEGCAECSCNVYGSSDPQCDSEGQCPCSGDGRVIGLKCDMCSENTYNLTAGCLACPACYNLVRDDVANVRELVANLTAQIDFIGSNPVNVNNTEFKSQLDEVLEDVRTLSAQVQSEVIEEQVRVNSILASLQSRLETLSADLSDRQDLVTEQNDTLSAVDVSVVLPVIEAIAMRLDSVQADLVNKGYRTLAKINDEIDMFGERSENMTLLAQEARNLTMAHEQLAADALEISTAALNASTEALRLARDITLRNQNSSDNAAALEEDLLELSTRLEEAREAGRAALAAAESLLSRALGAIFNTNAVVVPSFNASEYEADATAAITMSQEIRDNATALWEDLASTIRDQELAVNATLQALEDAQNEQRKADILLALVDQAYQRALEARNHSSVILEEAESILKQLQNFDEQVRVSKAQAELDLQNITQISEALAEAEEKTQLAEDSVDDAVEKAEAALRVAQNAQATADRASEAASNLKIRANQSMEEALSLETRLSDFSAKVVDTEKLLNDSVDESKKNQQAATDAIEQADQAFNKAEEAASQLDQALEDLKVLEEMLGNLDDVNISAILDIERRLNETEDWLDEEQLDDRIKALDEFSNMQTKNIAKHINSMEQLAEQVADVEQIVMYIPNKCLTRTTNEGSSRRNLKRRLRRRKKKLLRRS